MAQELTSEQQTIRSNCFFWRRYTIQLIKEEKWDLIEKNPCPSEECTLCQNPVLGKYLLRPLFIHPTTFTPAIQSVIERIYGPQTPEDWYRMLLENITKLSILRYFIEQRLIDINCGSYEFAIFPLYAQYYRREIIEIWDYLLSDEVGYNINVQDANGESPLLSYLRCFYDDNEDFDEEERTEECMLGYNEKIAYLLQKGADPLLEDKTGVSAWTYACQLSTFSQEQKERLIRMLENRI